MHSYCMSNTIPYTYKVNIWNPSQNLWLAKVVRQAIDWSTSCQGQCKNIHIKLLEWISKCDGLTITICSLSQSLQVIVLFSLFNRTHLGNTKSIVLMKCHIIEYGSQRVFKSSNKFACGSSSHINAMCFFLVANSMNINERWKIFSHSFYNMTKSRFQMWY